MITAKSQPTQPPREAYSPYVYSSHPSTSRQPHTSTSSPAGDVLTLDSDDDSGEAEVLSVPKTKFEQANNSDRPPIIHPSAASSSTRVRTHPPTASHPLSHQSPPREPPREPFLLSPGQAQGSYSARSSMAEGSGRQGVAFAPEDPEEKRRQRLGSAQASTSHRPPPKRNSLLSGPFGGGRVRNGEPAPPAAQRSSPTAPNNYKSTTRGSPSVATNQLSFSNRNQATNPTRVFSNSGDQYDNQHNQSRPSTSKSQPAVYTNSAWRDSGEPSTSKAQPQRANAQPPQRSPSTRPRNPYSSMSPTAVLDLAGSSDDEKRKEKSEGKGKGKAKEDKPRDESKWKKVIASGFGEQENDPIEGSEDELRLRGPFNLTSKRSAKSKSSTSHDGPTQSTNGSRGAKNEGRAANLQPRAVSQTARLATAGFDPDTTDEMNLEPESTKKKKTATAAVMELPIKPYALGPDYLFPVGHLTKPHRLSWNTKSAPKHRKLFVERQEETGFKQLLEFNAAHLSGVTKSSSTFLQLRFNKKTPPCGFVALCAGAFSHVLQWEALDSSERILTLVVDDNRHGDAFEQLLTMLHEWAQSSAVVESSIMGSGGDSRREEFIDNLNDAIAGKQSPPIARANPTRQLAPAQSRSSPSTAATDSTKRPVPAKDFYHSTYSDLPSFTKMTRSMAKEDTSEAKAKAKEKEKEREPPRPPKPKDLTPTHKLRLVWPHDNGMQITHGDIKRLEPDEFLNDTLIELGLKFIVDRRNDLNPGEPSDVHVFNSFFYKLLTQRKPNNAVDWDPYKSVRKWTSKFDLFAKKFVVIPINEYLHWYLAVIVNPAAILHEAPTPPPTPPPPSTRSHGPAAKNEPLEQDPALAAALFPDEAKAADEAGESAQSPPAEFEKFPKSGELEGGGPPPQTDESPAAVETRSEQEDEVVAMEGVEPQSVDEALPTSELRSNLSESNVLVPSTSSQPQPSQLKRVATSFTHSQTPPGEPAKDQTTEAVTRGVSEIDLAEQPKKDEPPPVSAFPFDPDKCYIYTFDSLQSSHKTAINKLRAYLVSEAKDKKRLTRPLESAVQGLEVIVPQQDNLSDCGLYLLHYGEKMLLGWDDIREFIHGPYGHAAPGKAKSAHYSSDKVKDAWDYQAAAGFRGTFKKNVVGLADEWHEKVEKPQLEKQKREWEEKEEKRRAARAAGQGDEQLNADDVAVDVGDEADSSIDLGQQRAAVDGEEGAAESRKRSASVADVEDGQSKVPLRVPNKKKGNGNRKLDPITLDDSDASSSDGGGSDFELPKPARARPQPAKAVDDQPQRSQTPTLGETPTIEVAPTQGEHVPDDEDSHSLKVRGKPPSRKAKKAWKDSAKQAAATRHHTPDKSTPSRTAHHPAEDADRQSPASVASSASTSDGSSSDSTEAVAAALHPTASSQPSPAQKRKRSPARAAAAVPLDLAGDNDVQVLGLRPEAQAAAAAAAEQRAKSSEAAEEQHPKKRRKKAGETDPSPPSRRSTRHQQGKEKVETEVVSLLSDDDK